MAIAEPHADSARRRRPWGPDDRQDCLLHGPGDSPRSPSGYGARNGWPHRGPNKKKAAAEAAAYARRPACAWDQELLLRVLG